MMDNHIHKSSEKSTLVCKINSSLLIGALSKRFANQKQLSEKMGLAKTVVNGWYQRGKIPTKHFPGLASAFSVDISTIRNLFREVESALHELTPQEIDAILDRYGIESPANRQKRLPAAPVQPRNHVTAERVEPLPAGMFQGPIWKIPVLGRVPGGDAVPLEDCFDGVMEIPAAMLATARARDIDLFALRIYGDSMAPTIPGGSLLFVDRRYGNFTRFRPGTIIVANLNGDCTCKELVIKQYEQHDSPFSESTPTTRIILHPHNPAFKDIEVTDTDYFRILGRVAAYIGFTPNNW